MSSKKPTKTKPKNQPPESFYSAYSLPSGKEGLDEQSWKAQGW